MERVLSTISVSDLRKDQTGTLAALRHGPLVLINRSGAAGVLVHPDHWNNLADELDDLYALVAGLEAELALVRGEDELEDVDLADLRERAGTHAVPD